MSEIHDLTAVDQAALFRSRELSPVEVTDHYLDRVQRLNDEVGAFITVTPELARQQARNAEQRFRVEDPAQLPALLGLCVPIKDLHMVAGVRCTLGSQVFADQVADADEGYVAMLRQAGAVFLGKTNTSEFGLSCSTENDIAPPARTPWDTTRSAGGSSGGAAAAVAAGLAPFAQGSDGGGSIRIPASVCGLYGIKPTRGRVTSAPLQVDTLGLAVTGPLARTVADAALLLDALTLTDDADLFTAPPLPEGETFLSAAYRDPGRLRVAGFAIPPLPEATVHPDVHAAYRATAQLLEELGHDVTEITPPFDGSHMHHFATVWAVTAARIPVPPTDEHRLRPLTRWLRERGRRTPAPAYLEAVEELQRFARTALNAFAPYDVVLTPTLAALPAPLGYFIDDDPAEEFARMNAFTPFGNIANLTGQPAVNVPGCTTVDGLPIGMMLFGRRGAEATLISLSAQLEAARPWRHCTPELWRC